MKRGETREHPIAYLGRNDKLPARLVIYRLTAAEQRNGKAGLKDVRQKPGQTKQKTKDMAGISVFVTNLPMSVPAKEVVVLYRYRRQWQKICKNPKIIDAMT